MNAWPLSYRAVVASFFAGALFALNLQGLITDIAGRDRTLAYLNDPATWVDSRVSAPLHVLAMVVCAFLAWSSSGRSVPHE